MLKKKKKNKEVGNGHDTNTSGTKTSSNYEGQKKLTCSSKKRKKEQVKTVLVWNSARRDHL